MIATILNVVTMLELIFFAGYLRFQLGEQKINLMKRIYCSVIRWSTTPLRSIKAKRVYLFCYPLIPALLIQVLAIARQFNIGKMYIKSDPSFIAGALIWLLLPLFVIGIINKNKKQNDNNKSSNKEIR